MGDKFISQQQIYDEKVRVLLMEKRSLQDEMRQALKLAGEREAMLLKEAKQLRTSNKQLLGFGEMREKLLQEELAAIKTEVHKIQNLSIEKEL